MMEPVTQTKGRSSFLKRPYSMGWRCIGNDAIIWRIRIPHLRSVNYIMTFKKMQEVAHHEDY